MSFADSPFASAPFAATGETNATVALTGFQLNIAENNLIVSAGGSIVVTAAEDQMEFSIGSVIAESESIVDVTGVSARFNDLARFSYSLDSQTAGFPILSNTQSKTGTTSAYFGSTNNEIQIPQSQDVIQSALSANNQFTIEFWYYIETATFAPRFISVQQTSGTSNRQLSIIEYQGQIYVENQQGTRIQAGSVSDQTWTHIAVTADNGTVKLYIDGVLEGTRTGTTFIDAQSEFNIGGTGPFSTTDNRFHLDGYMDLFRVSNNVRYTTTFTPPTSAFTVDDNTTIIFNFDGPNGSQDFELLQLPYSSTDIVADADVDVTGIELFTELGTETIVANSNVDVTGEVLSTELGTEVVTASALVQPTGLEISFAEGTVVTIGTANIDVTGEQIDSALGTEVIVADANVDVIGLEASLTDGTVEVIANADVIVTGLNIQFTEGTAQVTAAAIVDVTGIEVSTELGTETIVADANVDVTGLEINFTEGEVIVIGEVVVDVTGLEINFADGTVEVNAGATAEVTGLEISSQSGNVNITADADVNVTGQILTFAIGQVTVVDAWQPVDPSANNAFSAVSTGASNSWTEVAA